MLRGGQVVGLRGLRGVLQRRALRVRLAEGARGQRRGRVLLQTRVYWVAHYRKLMMPTSALGGRRRVIYRLYRVSVLARCGFSWPDGLSNP